MWFIWWRLQSCDLFGDDFNRVIYLVTTSIIDLFFWRLQSCDLFGDELNHVIYLVTTSIIDLFGDDFNHVVKKINQWLKSSPNKSHDWSRHQINHMIEVVTK